jgi:hypothetical protein
VWTVVTSGDVMYTETVYDLVKALFRQYPFYQQKGEGNEESELSDYCDGLGNKCFFGL